MKYISKGSVSLPFLFSFRGKRQRATPMIFIPVLNGGERKRERERKGEERERERNTRKSRFAPMKMQRSTAGAAGWFVIFFSSANRREFIAEKIRVSPLLRINTIPITSGVRLSRIRVPWQLATYLLSSFSFLFSFHFVSWKQKYTYIIEEKIRRIKRKKITRKRRMQKEGGKGKAVRCDLSRW